MSWALMPSPAASSPSRSGWRRYARTARSSGSAARLSGARRRTPAASRRAAIVHSDTQCMPAISAIVSPSRYSRATSPTGATLFLLLVTARGGAPEPGFGRDRPGAAVVPVVMIALSSQFGSRFTVCRDSEPVSRVTVASLPVQGTYGSRPLAALSCGPGAGPRLSVRKAVSLVSAAADDLLLAALRNRSGSAVWIFICGRASYR
jgi:hypothetical protein